MKIKLLLGFALVLSGGLMGCSTARHHAECALAISIALPNFGPFASEPKINISTNHPTSHFHVVISNHSGAPQYVVGEDGCSIGYEALHFELTDNMGKQYAIRRTPIAWVSDGLNWWVLEPGEQYVIDVNFGEVFQGHPAWDGFPANLRSGRFRLKAIFEPATAGLIGHLAHVVKAGNQAQAAAENVSLWYGRLESATVNCEIENW